MDATEITGYRCGRCGRVYSDRNAASGCCVHTCAVCGKMFEAAGHFAVLCEGCKDAAAKEGRRKIWDAAPKVKASEYDNPVYIIEDDTYCMGGVSEILDLYEEPPEWGVFGTAEEKIELSPDRIVELLEEHDSAYDGYEVEGEALRDIVDFCGEWNERHAATSYVPCDVGIVFDDEAGGRDLDGKPSEWKTRDELKAMTVKQLREYAKEIGCCLGYDASRKDTTICAIESHQRRGDRSWQ